MSIKVNIKQAKNLIIRAMKAKLVPMLSGSPGIGKSEMIYDIAKEFNLQVIDLRLAQCDPTDLLGFPNIDKEANRASYAPMDSFPIETDTVPEGKNGWLLFLDEFNHADRSVQKAAYKLILDRMVGNFKLHKNTAIICAGNLDTDNAMVEDMSTAMQSRLSPHLELTIDPDMWIEWATGNGVDHRITSYIRYKPNNLMQFDSNHSDKTFACPRTWNFLSRMIKDEKEITTDLLPLVAGTVSEGVGREFVSFTKIYKNLVTIAEILSNPGGVQVPTEPSMLYALSGSVAQNLNKDNFKQLAVFIDRLPIEFQIICLREGLKRKPELMALPEVSKWAINNAKDLY